MAGADLDRNYAAVWARLSRLPAGKKFVFCRNAHYNEVRGCLDWLHEKAAEAGFEKPMHDAEQQWNDGENLSSLHFLDSVTLHLLLLVGRGVAAVELGFSLVAVEDLCTAILCRFPQRRRSIDEEGLLRELDEALAEFRSGSVQRLREAERRMDTSLCCRFHTLARNHNCALGNARTFVYVHVMRTNLLVKRMQSCFLSSF